MNGLDDLIQRIPLDQLAARSGASTAEVESAVRAALPALLGGLQANAGDPAGEASLAEALDQHRGMGDGVVDIDQVDEADGSKITRHVFGDQTDQVVQKLGGTAGGNSVLVQKLLPLLAPIVLSYVAKQLGGSAKDGAAAGGLGAVLSQVLAGAAGGSSSKGGLDAGSIISDVLGGLLGGGRR